MRSKDTAEPGRRHWWARRSARPDPFEALAIQVRLAAVTAQLHTIDTDERMFARGRRRIAYQAAYDALLADACRLAGVSVPDGEVSEDERLREELELTARGWSW
ncbi:hypothetical protein OEB99_00225 [Actinotalea sp. M2MS4P-6]|uniref:hypothetical protein n=1 Tax=Actinotalea sp. M2MS4P-6 TaxID=2983762 RepID=UPI0021E376D7|nr:hypothetical protein [Actinotalea sp. M2MS4P-6]MCV2392723.1 hypothetical protein [Actinotalea sp. M2MS4P-6]